MQKENSGENTHIHFIFHSSCAVVFFCSRFNSKIEACNQWIVATHRDFSSVSKNTKRSLESERKKHIFFNFDSLTPSSRFFYSLFKKKNSYIFPIYNRIGNDFHEIETMMISRQQKFHIFLKIDFLAEPSANDMARSINN